MAPNQSDGEELTTSEVVRVLRDQLATARVITEQLLSFTQKTSEGFGRIESQMHSMRGDIDAIAGVAREGRIVTIEHKLSEIERWRDEERVNRRTVNAAQISSRAAITVAALGIAFQLLDKMGVFTR